MSQHPPHMLQGPGLPPGVMPHFMPGMPGPYGPQGPMPYGQMPAPPHVFTHPQQRPDELKKTSSSER